MKNPGFNFQNTYTNLPSCFFTETNAVSVREPTLVILNEDLCKDIDLDFKLLTEKETASLLSGNSVLSNMNPFAQAYAGHQFGYFTNLGDGRALMLGEHITNSGKRYDIQFKGSGPTSYSRQGDGKAVLGPMLREYIISEAMHSLKIPTTRSLAVVKTGEKILRETFLPGAILTRLASSHIRVGTFQYAVARQEKTFLQQLFDYTIERHYPQISNSKEKALELINILLKKQIHLVTNWMRVGFIHGVMNTDNTTLSGETIDYGPCAFMDNFNMSTVFSSVDVQGRYSYGNQPVITQWNLARFSETLLPLIAKNPADGIKVVEDIVKSFPKLYKNSWLEMMKNKLGISGESNEDEKLINDLLNLMEKNSVDYTNTFSDLTYENFSKGNFYQNEGFKNWYESYKKRLENGLLTKKDTFNLMRANNPYVIPRNHNVEHVLNESLQSNYSALFEILSVLKNPYKKEKVSEKFIQPADPSNRVNQTFCGT